MYHKAHLIKPCQRRTQSRLPRVRWLGGWRGGGGVGGGGERGGERGGGDCGDGVCGTGGGGSVGGGDGRGGDGGGRDDGTLFAAARRAAAISATNPAPALAAPSGGLGELSAIFDARGVANSRGARLRKLLGLFIVRVVAEGWLFGQLQPEFHKRRRRHRLGIGRNIDLRDERLRVKSIYLSLSLRIYVSIYIRARQREGRQRRRWLGIGRNVDLRDERVRVKKD